MTTTRHPAPSGCRKEPRVLSLRNNNTEPTKRMPAGTSATSALDNVAFITRLGERISVFDRSITTCYARDGRFPLSPRRRACLYATESGALSSELRRELSCGFANIGVPAISSRCQATSNTILPRACPVSLSSWACRASDSGSTVSTVGLIFPESTSVASSASSDEPP